MRERFIHGEVYKARPDVMAVVHNHSPSVIPFSVTGVPLRPVFHMAAFIGARLPNFEIRDVEQGTDLLVKTPRLGEALAQTLGAKPGGPDARPRRRRGRREPAARGRPQHLPRAQRAMQMQAHGARRPGRWIVYLDEAEVQASFPCRTTAAPGRCGATRR